MNRHVSNEAHINLGRRRAILSGMAAGALTLNFGGWLATPRMAVAANLQPTTLTDAEAKTLAALGEVLVPGARSAGIAPFVDQQLGAPLSESLLMIRYLGVEPPFLDFYQGGLAALDSLANAQHDTGFADLDGDTQNALVGSFAGANPEGWTGPPSPFFYFVLRSDAIDVVYGTPEGFRDLGVPYAAHIPPPSSPWRNMPT